VNRHEKLNVHIIANILLLLFAKDHGNRLLYVKS